MSLEDPFELGNDAEARGGKGVTGTRKGGRYPHVEIGEVAIEVSEDQEPAPAPKRGGGGSTESRLDTDPICVAVKNADHGVWYKVVLESDEKNGAAKKLMRRAGVRHGVSVHFDPRYTADTIRFSVGERKTRKRKAAEAEDAPASE